MYDASDAGAARPAPHTRASAGSGPLVSAIIIFLNGERFLSEAIESILEQTYDRWELILVDDGSTDASAGIAAQYVAARPDRIRCVTHPEKQNRGMSASRNLGIACSSGELIAFLDADDVWLPRKLEEQVAVFAENPTAGMVYGRTQIWSSWTGRGEDASRDHFVDLGVQPDTLVDPPTLFIQLLRNRAQSPTTCNAIIRRELIEAVAGFEDDFRGHYEDQVFFAKIHLLAPAFVADAFWARYRQHPDACTAMLENRVDYQINRRPFLRWLEAYIQRERIQLAGPAATALRTELRAARHPRATALLNLARSGLARIRGSR